MYNFENAKESILTPQAIIDVIVRYYNITEKVLTSETRKKEIVTVRKYASYCLVKHCKKKTLLELSKYLGYNAEGSHATLLFHSRDVDKKMPIYPDIKLEIENLEKELSRYVDNSLMMGGLTVQDAINNPKILDLYRKKEDKGNHDLALEINQE
tara:strand:+ start:249 stop:710 length:462 start_codon:yes stop_codon:yes gene_type:complete